MPYDTVLVLDFSSLRRHAPYRIHANREEFIFGPSAKDPIDYTLMADDFFDTDAILARVKSSPAYPKLLEAERDMGIISQFVYFPLLETEIILSAKAHALLSRVTQNSKIYILGHSQAVEAMEPHRHPTSSGIHDLNEHLFINHKETLDPSFGALKDFFCILTLTPKLFCDMILHACANIRHGSTPDRSPLKITLAQCHSATEPINFGRKIADTLHMFGIKNRIILHHGIITITQKRDALFAKQIYREKFVYMPSERMQEPVQYSHAQMRLHTELRAINFKLQDFCTFYLYNLKKISVELSDVISKTCVETLDFSSQLSLFNPIHTLAHLLPALHQLQIVLRRHGVSVPSSSLNLLDRIVIDGERIVNDYRILRRAK